MEKLFLNSVLASNKLNVINEKDIDSAEFFLKEKCFFILNRMDDLVREVFTSAVQNLDVWVVF